MNLKLLRILTIIMSFFFLTGFVPIFSFVGPGVTVLTSLDNKALREIGFSKDVKKLVLHQVKLANKAKLDAIVCSAQEVKLVKKYFKKEIITPGIRFTSKKNDQKRVLTPNEAYSNGADWLVLGRDLTKGNIKKNTQTLIDHLSK